MINFDGAIFNDQVSRVLLAHLGEHDAQYQGLMPDMVPSKVSRSVFMSAVAQFSGLAFIPKVAEFCDQELLDKCSTRVLTRGQFAPVCRVEDRLLVALVNPWNTVYEGYLNQMFPDYQIEPVISSASEIGRCIEGVMSSAAPTSSELDSIEVDEEQEHIEDFDITKDYSEPMIQLIATIIAKAVKRQASDIHFKVEKESFYYSFRIDGDLGMKTELPMKLKDRLDAYLLNLMKLPVEIRNTSPGISGRFAVAYFNRTIDIRYERHRTYRGFHITMRLLDKGNIEATLGKGSLAFDSKTLFELNRMMAVPAGIIVMSGPTGSGKSTTLNAILRELNRPEVNILTLENPVEDEIAGVTHCNLKKSSEFKPMIASFMRSDPDIILMGEVRDMESAELAIEAAVTGHKVLTTIHTQRASQIIERFEQLGIERWKIAQTLKAACAQRLVKLLCPSCKVEMPGVSKRERGIYQLDESWAERTVYEANQEGCNDCGGKGYVGRTAILELIPISPKVSDQLSKGEISPFDLEQKVFDHGELPSLRTSGLSLLTEGKSDLKSISKVIDMSYASE